jgi:hypothetical protein
VEGFGGQAFTGAVDFVPCIETIFANGFPMAVYTDTGDLNGIKGNFRFAGYTISKDDGNGFSHKEIVWISLLKSSGNHFNFLVKFAFIIENVIGERVKQDIA